jgi:hypothetical protein
MPTMRSQRRSTGNLITPCSLPATVFFRENLARNTLRISVTPEAAELKLYALMGVISYALFSI